MLPHEHYMRAAYREAERAFEEEEVPVGAVVVCRGQIIAKGYNQVERLNDVTAHAEMIALTSASGFLGSKYLNQCYMYVTLEPCLMCATALSWAKLGGLVFGASDPERGFIRLGERILHPKTEVIGGIMEKECAGLLQEFFQLRRN